MALSPAQTKIYWRTWSKIAAALQADQPEATKAQIQDLRHSQHTAAGCPRSSKAWTSRDLDRWIYLEDRISDPLNLPRLLELEEKCHPEAARIYVIRKLLTQLGKPVSYAAACTGEDGLSPNLCSWSAKALQTAVMALSRTSKRAQLPGKDPF